MSRRRKTIHLVAPSVLVAGLDLARLPGITPVESLSDRARRRVRDRLGRGDDLVLIGAAHEGLLEDLWIHSYPMEGMKPTFRLAPGFPGRVRKLRFRKGNARCGFVCPPILNSYTSGNLVLPRNIYHGIDEEYRADFHPLVEARDRYDGLIGYPGFMVKHTHSTLVSGQYRHGAWFVFLFDDPLEALNGGGWQRLLEDIVAYRGDRVYFAELRPQYAAYHPGETARIGCEVSNASDEVVCGRVRFALLSGAEDNAAGSDSRQVAARRLPHTPVRIEDGVAEDVVWSDEVRFALNLQETTRVEAECPVPAGLSGYVTLEATLLVEDRFRYGPQRDASLQRVEGAQSGLWVYAPDTRAKGPTVKASGCRVAIDGTDGFHVGMHHYMTSCFFDFNWRDFRLDRARTNLLAMRAHGMRLIRLWVDPFLDEESLRGLDAAIELCQELRIVVDLTLFSQWVDEHGINLDGTSKRCTLWTERDYNLSGVSFRHMDFQREWVGVLAQRYRDVPGLVWNLTNEGAIVDPDREQLADADWLDPQHRKLKPPYDSMDLVNQWLAETKRTIRRNGARQPVISTYVWSGANGSSYSTNKVGDIGTQHDYQATIPTVAVEDLSCWDKPLLVEEFGINTDDDRVRADHYDSIMHYAFGLGTAGAISYEWGVSWMAKRLPTTDPFLKYPSTIEKQDPRWLGGQYHRWPVGGLGFCPYAASYQFGSTYSLTSIPTEAVRMMQRFACFGHDLGSYPHAKRTYVVLPMEWDSTLIPARGRLRKSQRIHETLQRLRREHVDFGIVHEDALDRIPRSARVVIVPCEDAPSPMLRRGMELLRRRGVDVFCGEDDRWAQCPGLARLPLVNADDVDVLVRDVKRGQILVLHDTTATPRRVAARLRGRRVELDLAGFGMVGIRSGSVFLAEAGGGLTVDGEPVLARASGRYLIRTFDGGPLAAARSSVVVPFEPLDLTFPGGVLATAMDLTNGREIGPVKAYRAAGETRIRIDAEAARYAVRISRL